MEQRRAVAATLSLLRDMEAQEGRSIIRQGVWEQYYEGAWEQGAPLARVSLLRNMGAGGGKGRLVQQQLQYQGTWWRSIKGQRRWAGARQLP